MVPQIRLACWIGLRVLKELRGTGVHAEVLVGQVLVEDLGTWPFMVKGYQHQIFLDNRPLILKGLLCSSSGYVLVLWSHEGGPGRGTCKIVVPGAAGARVLSSVHASAAWLVVLSVVSEKPLGTSSNRTEPFGTGSTAARRKAKGRPPTYRLISPIPHACARHQSIVFYPVFPQTAPQKRTVLRNSSSVTEFIFGGFSEQSEVHFPLFFLFLGFSVFTVVGNLGLIILIGLNSSLHSPMYFFLFNLSLIDLCHSCVFTPKMPHDFVSENIISYAGCMTQPFFFCFLVTSECCVLVSIAYDR